MPFMQITDLKAMPFNSAFPMLLYIGAVLGIGAVMTVSGAGDALSRLLVASVPLQEASNPVRLTMLAVIAAATSLVTTMPVAPAHDCAFLRRDCRVHWMERRSRGHEPGSRICHAAYALSVAAADVGDGDGEHIHARCNPRAAFTSANHNTDHHDRGPFLVAGAGMVLS